MVACLNVLSLHLLLQFFPSQSMKTNKGQQKDTTILYLYSPLIGQRFWALTLRLPLPVTTLLPSLTSHHLRESIFWTSQFVLHIPTPEIFTMLSHYVKIKSLYHFLEIAWKPLEDKGLCLIILVLLGPSIWHITGLW